MGRGRGKGKKQSARDENASGEDEKLPVRRRGRPQKPLKDDIEQEDEYEVDKIEQEELDKDESKVLNKDTKNQTVSENLRKRKRPSEVKENEVVIKTNSNELIKSVGYRQNGSRRKNKPRRAAEVGVECK